MRFLLSCLCSAALTTFTLVGCDTRSANTPDTPRASSPDSAGPSQAMAPPPATDSATRAPTVVSATLAEWKVDLSRDTVPAGPTRFEIVNRGTEVHTFEVEGNEFEVAAEEIDPGANAMMTVNLTPGEWTVYCPMVTPSAGGNHGLRGMKRTLIVR